MASRTAPGAPRLERRFRLSERGTSVRTEMVAGVTTFMTMAYILFVNPAILGTPGPADDGLAFPAVLTVTALVAGVMTIAMGVFTNYPFAIASGLGLNAVVAFQLVGGEGMTYPEAMGVVVAEGLLLTVLVLAGFREAVMNAIPLELKKAIGAGIGLFIAIIGFANSGIVIPGPGAGGPVLARGDVDSARIAVFVVGLLLTALLVARRTKGALLFGILGTTVLATVVNAVAGGRLWDDVGEGVARLPEQVLALPDFSLLGAFSFGFVRVGAVAAVLAVFTLLLADFFDTMGTAIALGYEGGFLDERGSLPRMRRLLVVDGMAAAFGGAASASSATTYIESAAGISEGGRSGLASVVTGVLFLAALFISPLAGVIPPEATAPALILVGFLMMSVIRDLPWDDYSVAIPAFLTMVVMPFNFSITDGIGWGFISYTVIQLALGRWRNVHPLMAVSSLFFFVYFALDPIRRLVGLG
ncbi:MAG TPA: NCS2 family permease [Egibacteraceae bacterium]|nr:NCS2 family permease [Egibacteraceae bacterium]